MAKVKDFNGLVKDALALDNKYDDTDIATLAIKYNGVESSINAYVSVTKAVERGQLLKGNYGSQFLGAMVANGLNPQFKHEAVEQPKMGLMAYEVTGNVEDLKEENELLKSQLEVYKKRYNNLCNSIAMLSSAHKSQKKEL